MKILLVAYILISIIAGYGAWTNAGWIVGGGLIVASMLGWFAGSGVRGSMIAGDKKQKVFGLIMGAIFLLFAHLITSYTRFTVNVLDYTVGGGLWYLIGFAVGFIATTKSDTETRESK